MGPGRPGRIRESKGWAAAANFFCLIID